MIMRMKISFGDILSCPTWCLLLLVLFVAIRSLDVHRMSISLFVVYEIIYSWGLYEAIHLASIFQILCS